MTIKMILTNSFSSDVRVYKEAKYLVEKGHKVEVLCWDKTPEKGLPATDCNSGIEIRRFGIPSVEGSGYRQIVPFIKFISACRKYLKKKSVDVLHCHDLDGAIVGYLCRKKFVFDMHEFYDKGRRFKKKINHRIVRSLSQKSSSIICVSEKNIEAYGKGIEHKFHLLKNYCDSAMFSSIEKTESDTLRIAYVGRVRNQISEFEALFQAVKDLDKTQVDIYGDGPDLPMLKSMSEDISNVYVHGAFDGVKESESIYRNVDISFIAYDPDNPNYQREFEPVKLFEAIITKTPVITTKNLYPGKVADKLGIGFSIDTRSCQEIRTTLLSVLQNQAILDGIKQNYQTIENKYDWQQAVGVLDKVYESL